MTPGRSVEQTIAVMGKAAVDASKIWALAEWARTTAAGAPRRDYVAQLRRIFDAIARRWRYVMESEEWVHGDGVSLIRVVLGSKYNGDPDLRRVSLADVPVKNPGFGDCDDVSQAVAACVLAIGMRPFFRVVMGPRGGHVSVLARTPRGQIVSLDPVGLPDHQFGWMMPAAPEHVTIYDVSGKQVNGMGCPDTGASTALKRAERTFKPVDLMKQRFSPANGPIMAQNALELRRGNYLACAPCMFAGENELGSIKDVRRRWKKRARAVKGAVRTVRRLHNKVVAKILSNKVAQKLVGTVLMAYGVPPLVAPAVMRMGAEIIKNDGLIGFVKRLKKDPKLAIKMVQQAIKKGLIPKNALTGKAAEIAKSLSGEQYAFTQMIPLGASSWSVATKTPDQAAESVNVKIALADRPKSSRGETQKPGQAESDWLSNVVLWETYPKSPIDLDTKKSSHKPYISAWVRISKNIKNGLSVAKTASKSSGTTKKPFAINTQENAIADEVVAKNPKSQIHRGGQQTRKSGQTASDWLANVAYWRAYPEGPTVIRNDKPHADAWRRIAARVNLALKSKSTTPSKKTTPTSPGEKANKEVEDRMKPGALEANARIVWGMQPDAYKGRNPKADLSSKENRLNWYADVIYWGTWPRSPIVIPKNDSVNRKRWLQAREAVQGVNKTNVDRPTTTTPTTKTIMPMSTNCWEDDRLKMSICRDIARNPEEIGIAKRVVSERPKSEVAAGLRRTRSAGQSEADWLANVAYWRAYPEGPADIPGSAQQYADAWNRIKAEVRSALKTKPTTTTPKLPDIEPDPGPNKLPDLDPDPGPSQDKTNWLPIVAGAAALLLALK